MDRHYFERGLGYTASARKCVECGQDRDHADHIRIGEDAIDPRCQYCESSKGHRETCIEAVVAYVNKRAEILQNAEQMINGPRADTYGHPSVNFGRIAAMWNAAGFHISLDGKPGRGVNATDVALAMLLVKAARLVTSPDHEDSWTDAAGYAGIGGELGTSPK